MPTFFFVETLGSRRGAIASCRKFSDAFGDAFSGATPSVLRFCNGSEIFSNGYVVRELIGPDLPTNYAYLRAPLDAAARWAMFRPKGPDFIEHPENGPLSDLAWLMNAPRFVLFFLLAKEDDAAFMDRVREMQSAIGKSPSCVPAVFVNGAVLVAATDQPFKVLARRCERQLVAFKDWCVESSWDEDDPWGKDEERDYFG